MTEQWCTVVSRTQLNSENVILTMSGMQIAEQAVPGQFVNLLSNQFLRRPLGIMKIDRNKGEFSIGIRIKGEGTRYLSQLQHGSQISVLGPLGHGFDLSGYDRVITVGGGTGVFPLYFLQQVCKEKQIEGIAVCGYRSLEESILVEEFAGIACASCFSSDVGGLEIDGHAGLALENVLAGLADQGVDMTNTLIAACGPEIMLQRIAESAEQWNLDCQVSLEQRMACGIGICLVCACKVKSGKESEEWEHQRCCVEGPVFDAREVVW